MDKVKFIIKKNSNIKREKLVLFILIIPLLILNSFFNIHSAQRIQKISAFNDSNLNTYLKYAAKNNPGLKAAFKKWKSFLEKKIQVKTLPDPNFTFSYFINEVETRVGPQKMKIGVMQKFPWFGKLKLRGDRIFAQSEALRENFEKIKLDLFYKVKKLYYDYYLANKSVEIIRENISLLRAANKQMNSMYSTGIASYSNLIRLQVELDKLRDKEESLTDKLPSIRMALNSVMNRPFNTNIVIEKTIENISYSIEGNSLLLNLEKYNPELKKIDYLIESKKIGKKLAKKNYLPDFSVGADLIVTGLSPMDGVLENGKDPIIVKMGINIPIGIKRIKASVREADLNLSSVMEAKQDRINSLTALLHSVLFKFNDSGRKIRLYRDSLIPKARQAFEVTKTAFSTGKSGFLDFIDTQRILLGFELKLEKAKSSHLQNIALIEKLIGTKVKNIKKEEN